MTNYSHLLEDRSILREPAARGQVKQQLAAARRDLETARRLLTDENQWAYTIAYNAMLLAGRAVVFSEGYIVDDPMALPTHSIHHLYHLGK